MENASKALLIAASVLIVILLIAFGIRIFNSTSGSADQIDGTMQTTETAMFNNKFTTYFGKNKTKSQVISLVNVVIASNASSGRMVIMTIENSMDENSNNLMQNASNLSSVDKYEIGLDDGAGAINNGYIYHIKVKKMP